MHARLLFSHSYSFTYYTYSYLILTPIYITINSIVGCCFHSISRSLCRRFVGPPRPYKKTHFSSIIQRLLYFGARKLSERFKCSGTRLKQSKFFRIFYFFSSPFCAALCHSLDHFLSFLWYVFCYYT